MAAAIQVNAGAMRVDMAVEDEGLLDNATKPQTYPPTILSTPPVSLIEAANFASNMHMKDMLSGYNLGDSTRLVRRVTRYRDKNLREHGLKELEDEVGLIAAMPQELCYKELRSAGRRRVLSNRALFSTKRGLQVAQNLGSSTAKNLDSLFSGVDGDSSQPRKKRRTGPRIGVAGAEDDDGEEDEEGGTAGLRRHLDQDELSEDEEEVGYNSSEHEVEMDYDEQIDDDEEYDDNDDDDGEAAM